MVLNCHFEIKKDPSYSSISTSAVSKVGGTRKDDSLDLMRSLAVALDINLPGMNGFEALRQLKDDPVTSNIPVIAISANAMEQDVKKGLNAGFIGYLTKPLDIPKLLALLDTLLNKSEGNS